MSDVDRTVQCSYCGKDIEFYTRPMNDGKYKNRFCSNNCKSYYGKHVYLSSKNKRNIIRLIARKEIKKTRGKNPPLLRNLKENGLIDCTNEYGKYYLTHIGKRIYQAIVERYGEKEE